MLYSSFPLAISFAQGNVYIYAYIYVYQPYSPNHLTLLLPLHAHMSTL